MHEITGTVKEVFDEQTFASGFNKREFVVTESAEKYPQDIKFECVKDKVEMVNNLNIGDEVTVTFNIRGNEYNGKYYVNLQAWKVSVLRSNATESPEPTEADFADDPMDEKIPF